MPYLHWQRLWSQIVSERLRGLQRLRAERTYDPCASHTSYGSKSFVHFSWVRLPPPYFDIVVSARRLFYATSISLVRPQTGLRLNHRQTQVSVSMPRATLSKM